MGFLSKAVKVGLAAKAIDVARREAAKPQNQQRARELLNKVRSRGTSR